MSESYDVVVVGSGGGALTGASIAARAGLSTMVLESTGLAGGTSAYSGGACWLPGTDVQQRAGIPDSTESARSYLAAVLDRPDQRKVDAFLAHAPELVAELETDPDFDFEWLAFPEYFDAPGRVPFGRSIQPSTIQRSDLRAEVAALIRPPVERDRTGRAGRSTLSGGQALIGRLLSMVVRDGGQIRTGHRVTSLLVEDERVVGVVAETDAGQVEIRAGRGVLIGSGGFEGNQALREKNGVPGNTDWTMSPLGTNIGEPLEAAVAIGAATELLDQGWFCPGLQQADGSGSFTVGFRGGVMVDATGRRYANESLPYDQLGREMARAPERIPSWFVFDSREGGRLPAIAMPEGDPAEHLASGTWVRADSIGDLATAMQVPAGALVETVGRFNGFATTGVDEEFGRGIDEYDAFFAGGEGPNKALVAIDRAPYFAASFVLSDLGTKGGLVTGTNGRVLREDGSAISGLYACGNAAANVMGSVYPGPGVPLATAMVFASLAVRELRKERR